MEAGGKIVGHSDVVACPGEVRSALGLPAFAIFASSDGLRRDSLRPPLRCGRSLEARTGIEPVYEVLQTQHIPNVYGTF